jgi:hypothetical protein
MSLIHKGKIITTETRLKMSNSLKGKPKSKEFKEKCMGRVSPNKSNKHSEETKLKMSNSSKGSKGFKHTEETKKIIREKRKLQIITNDTKEKMSESSKNRLKIICEKCNREFYTNNFNQHKCKI